MHIALKNITKSFGHTKACDDISLEIETGKIHCILGDNGAGKSTLMKILTGLEQPDSGESVLDTKSYSHLTPDLAVELNISMVYQGFSLVEEFSVLENLQLGSKSQKNSIFAKNSAFIKLPKSAPETSISSDLATLDLNTRVEDLDMGQRQQLEILKAINPIPNILILDEPTTFLDEKETTQLKATLKDLAKQGCAIVFISHDLDEALDISDSISVLANGRVVEQAQTTNDKPANLIYGKQNIRQSLASSISGMDDPLLEIKNLVVSKNDALTPINLSVHPSEILALTGRGVGSVTDISVALMEVFLGITKPIAGEIYINKRLLQTHIPGAIKEAGVAVIPKNREHSACIPEMSVLQNLFLLDPISNRGFLNKSEMYAKANKLLTQYNVTPPDPDMKMSELSGGNQQRILLARELSSNPKILIVEGLIEGLDVKAVDDICWNIQRAASRGIGVLMFTNDSDLLQLAHTRIDFEKFNFETADFKKADFDRSDL